MLKPALRPMIIAAALVATLPVCAATLDRVIGRGALNCGCNPGLAGFGMPDDRGNWTGLDIDYCRAIASAVFGDPTKVDFVPLTAKNRFTALQTGEVDVLLRGTTWTATRDSTLGLIFGAVNFYDGQSFMVQRKLAVSSAKSLDGASICVQQGTTSELNLADYFRTHGMTYNSISFEAGDQLIEAFESGRCDAITDDSSALYSGRLKLVDPSGSIVLPEIISKEPLASAVRQGDDQWLNIVRWTHYAMVRAEELGVTSTNVDDMRGSAIPEVRRLLGIEGEIGKGLGLSNDWAYKIVKKVGNYGEVFERNVGSGSKLNMKRGMNALWSDGGLQYAPPFR